MRMLKQQPMLKHDGIVSSNASVSVSTTVYLRLHCSTKSDSWHSVHDVQMSAVTMTAGPYDICLTRASHVRLRLNPTP